MTEEEMQELAYRCEHCGRFAFIARIDDVLECDHCETKTTWDNVSAALSKARKELSN